MSLITSSRSSTDSRQPVDARSAGRGRGHIEVRGVTRSFATGKGKSRADRLALDTVDLTIPQGQFVALVGASGCGKTTLLNMIAGLLPPSTGTITLGESHAQCPNFDVGYMFARHALLPWRKVVRNVELGMEVRPGWSRGGRRRRAQEMLDLVGLSSYYHALPGELSQGMRQRAAIARTLAPDPNVLLMDEPFAALDARTKLVLQREFLSIWERDGFSDGDTRKTVVFVTHDLSEAILLADRVIVMLPSPGRIAGDHVIPLPRPRADDLGDILFTDQFRELHHSFFHELEGAMGSGALTKDKEEEVA